MCERKIGTPNSGDISSSSLIRLDIPDEFEGIIGSVYLVSRQSLLQDSFELGLGLLEEHHLHAFLRNMAGISGVRGIVLSMDSKGEMIADVVVGSVVDNEVDRSAFMAANRSVGEILDLGLDFRLGTAITHKEDSSMEDLKDRIQADQSERELITIVEFT